MLLFIMPTVEGGAIPPHLHCIKYQHQIVKIRFWACKGIHRLGLVLLLSNLLAAAHVPCLPIIQKIHKVAIMVGNTAEFISC